MKKKYTTAPTLLCFLAILLVLFLTQNQIAIAAKYVVAMFKTVRK